MPKKSEREKFIASLRRIMTDSTSAVERVEARKQFERLVLNGESPPVKKTETLVESVETPESPTSAPRVNVLQLNSPDGEFSMMAALEKRDGVHSIGSLLLWRHQVQLAGAVDYGAAMMSEQKLEKEIEWWKRYKAAQPSEMAKLFVFPIRIGRQWDAAMVAEMRETLEKNQ